MGETSYHKEKIYLPRDVREKLGLVDGDRLYVEATGSGEARLIVIRASKAGGWITTKSRRIKGQDHEGGDL